MLKKNKKALTQKPQIIKTANRTGRAVFFSAPAVVSQRPQNTFFRNTRIRLKAVTSSLGHTTTVALTTRWMTSPVQSVYNNSFQTPHSVTGLRGRETQRVGTPHGLGPRVVSDSRPSHISDRRGRTITKDGSSPRASSAEVKEVRPSSDSHSATRVRDMWHDGKHILESLTRYIPSGNSESVWVGVCGNRGGKCF